MILWIIAIGLTIVFALLMLLVFIRKLHYDAIHRNLLDLEDAYGGRVIRGGFAIRPRYSGTYKGKKIWVSITSSREKDGRAYHIEVSMQAKSKYQFSVMSSRMLEGQQIEQERETKMISLNSGKYILEVIEKGHLKQLNNKKLEPIIEKMDPFEFILVSKNQIMLERISHDLMKDTDIRQLGNLIKSLDDFRAVLA
ncbi:MAG: hypothetical protein ACE5GL_01855 [Calditrichia bacterium]